MYLPKFANKNWCPSESGVQHWWLGTGRDPCGTWHCQRIADILYLCSWEFLLLICWDTTHTGINCISNDTSLKQQQQTSIFECCLFNFRFVHCFAPLSTYWNSQSLTFYMTQRRHYPCSRFAEDEGSYKEVLNTADLVILSQIWF